MSDIKVNGTPEKDKVIGSPVNETIFSPKTPQDETKVFQDGDEMDTPTSGKEDIPKDVADDPKDGVETPKDGATGSKAEPEDGAGVPKEDVNTPKDEISTPKDQVITPKEGAYTPLDVMKTPLNSGVTPMPTKEDVICGDLFRIDSGDDLSPIKEVSLSLSPSVKTPSKGIDPDESPKSSKKFHSGEEITTGRRKRINRRSLVLDPGLDVIDGEKAKLEKVGSGGNEITERKIIKLAPGKKFRAEAKKPMEKEVKKPQVKRSASTSLEDPDPVTEKAAQEDEPPAKKKYKQITWP